MIYYKTVAGYAEAEQVIDKSRFIGYIKSVETREEAEAFIKEIRTMHKSATHNVPAYVIGEKSQLQWASDDGEPSGTSGAPMLHMFVGEGITNVVIVVTRYFGGVLLGAGGLVRAYTKGAKIAIDAAGKSMKRVWTVLYVPCPYTYYERVKLEVEAFGGIIRSTEFGAEVELEILLAEAQAQPFLDRLTDMTAATVEGMETGKEYRAFPI